MRKLRSVVFCTVTSVLLAMLVGTGVPRAAEPAPNSTTAAAEVPRPLATVAEARQQAAILHDAMHATLQVVHHRFYRADEGLPLPAAALKEIFAEVEQEQQIKLRWLAVEGAAMNADHKPRDAFERAAFAALKRGQRSYDHAENGIYRRAGAIALTNHCLKCHVPDRKSTETRTAGLIVEIPVRRD